jgi:DHA1 family tetracycline resistance protein-like MFS transporter
MKKRSLALLFSVVFMDMVGFGFIIPILPDYISTMGATQDLLGLVLAVYALGQFIAAPVVGALSDRFGRKPLLLLSIGGTFASLLLLGFAKALPLIVISRLLDGLTGGNITVAQSYIADSTGPEDRAKGLGLIGMAFGLGFVLGPLFGGLLVSISLSAPAFIAAGIAALNLIIIAFVLPESLPAEKRQGTRSISILNIKAFRQVFSMADIRRYLGIIFFYTLAFNMFETMFSSHSMLAVGLTPQIRGLVLAYMGILIAVMQGGIVGRLTKKYHARGLLRFSNALLIVSMLGWAFTDELWQLFIVVTPISVGAAIQNVVQKSQLSLAVDDRHQGMALGVSASLESINRVIAPIIGGLLLSRVGLWAPGIASAAVLLVTMILILGIPRRKVAHADAPGPSTLAEGSDVFQ